MEQSPVFGNSTDLKKIFNTNYLNKPVCELSTPMKQFISEYKVQESVRDKKEVSSLVIKEDDNGKKTKASFVRVATPEELEAANMYITNNMDKYREYNAKCAALSKVKYRLNSQVGLYLDVLCKYVLRDLYQHAATVALATKFKMVRVKHLYAEDTSNLDSYSIIGSLSSYINESKLYHDKALEVEQAKKIKQALDLYKKELKSTCVVKLKDGAVKPSSDVALKLKAETDEAVDQQVAQEAHKKLEFSDVIANTSKYIKSLPQFEGVKFGSDLHTHANALLSELFSHISSTIIRSLKLFNGKTVSVDVLRFAVEELASRTSGLLAEKCKLEIADSEDLVTMAKLRLEAKNNGQKFDKKSVPLVPKLSAFRQANDEPRILLAIKSDFDKTSSLLTSVSRKTK